MTELGEDIYAVERIAGHWIEGGEYWYFVKWEGYGEEMNTWEPEHSLRNATLAMAAHWIDDLVTAIYAIQQLSLTEGPEPLIDLSENTYEVERVDGHWEKGGDYGYLVKWKGYGVEESTWEPARHLTDAKLAVVVYWTGILVTAIYSLQRYRL